MEGKESKPSNTQSCVVSTPDEGGILYSKATTIIEGRKGFTEVWLSDSTTIWHLTSHREWFHQYEPISGGSMYIGNDHAFEIFGVDSIKVNMDDGVICLIPDIQHVKGLNKNLLSMGQLDDHEYEFHAKGGVMKVIRGALVVMKPEKIAINLYMMHGRTYQEVETSVVNSREELIMRWHYKLGHMKEKGLTILFDQKLLPRLKTLSLPFCEHCYQ